jgi:hypothetical protein
MPDTDQSKLCWWRWRFQPVLACWGHLGIDYAFEDPKSGREYWLRHVDYGLPGDRSNPNYRHSIALHCAMVARCGDGWPPVRTPFGRIYRATQFLSAPKPVAEFLLERLPRFWGAAGAYRTIGPNSNTGLRLATQACSAATGYAFDHPPTWMRLCAWGWDLRYPLEPADGPYPGYFDDPTRFRWIRPVR